MSRRGEVAFWWHYIYTVLDPLVELDDYSDSSPKQQSTSDMLFYNYIMFLVGLVLLDR
jgi:hypothetical protein